MSYTLIVLITVWLTISLLSYIFYYLSLRYWKKKDLLDKLGWGILSLPKKYKKLPEPGRTYGEISMILYTTAVFTGLAYIIFGIVRIIWIYFK